MDKEEGWAPASYVKKVFHQEKSKPPPRPKPPSPSNKPSQSQVRIDAVSKSSAMLNRTDDGDASPRKSPTLLKPKKTAAANGKLSLQNTMAPKPTTAKTNADYVAGVDCKPTSRNGETPKPTNARPTARNVSAAKSNLKTSFSNAASKNQPAVKPLSKPLPINKPKLKSPPASGNSQLQKKLGVPPANGYKKPMTSRKPDVAQQDSNNHSGQVDFRSVLRSASNSNRMKSIEDKNGNLYKRPSGNPGSKPSVADKPAPKIAASKTTSLMTGKAAATNASKEKSALRPAAKPGAKLKPVLQRFQQNSNFPNQNWNNNNIGSDEQAKPSVAIVNRVELEHSVPSDLFQLRGTPDGKVDDVIIGDSKSRDDKASDLVRYIAVADFEAENPNEVTFSGGDEAWLIEKSDRGWWYMKIKNKVGWVPCFYFEKESPVAEKESAFPKIDSCEESVKNPDLSPKANFDTDDDPLYEEIYEEFHVNRDDDLYRTICSYTATDESVLSVGSGDMVRVLERNDSGWWFVRIIASAVSFVSQEGWLSCDYLEKV